MPPQAGIAEEYDRLRPQQRSPPLAEVAQAGVVVRDKGQVLVLVPSDWPHDDRKGVCSRQECVMLNGYAEEIVNE